MQSTLYVSLFSDAQLNWQFSNSTFSVHILFAILSFSLEFFSLLTTFDFVLTLRLMARISTACNATMRIMVNFACAALNAALNAMFQLKKKVTTQAAVALAVGTAVGNMLTCTSKLQ